MYLNEMWDKSEEASFSAIQLCVLRCLSRCDAAPQNLINVVKMLFFMAIKCAESAGLRGVKSLNGACACMRVLVCTCVRKTDMPVCVILVLSRRQD